MMLSTTLIPMKITITVKWTSSATFSAGPARLPYWCMQAGNVSVTRNLRPAESSVQGEMVVLPADGVGVELMESERGSGGEGRGGRLVGLIHRGQSSVCQSSLSGQCSLQFQLLLITAGRCSWGENRERDVALADSQLAPEWPWRGCFGWRWEEWLGICTRSPVQPSCTCLYTNSNHRNNSVQSTTLRHPTC